MIFLAGRVFPDFRIQWNKANPLAVVKAAVISSKQGRRILDLTPLSVRTISAEHLSTKSALLLAKRRSPLLRNTLMDNAIHAAEMISSMDLAELCSTVRHEPGNDSKSSWRQ